MANLEILDDDSLLGDPNDLEQLIENNFEEPEEDENGENEDRSGDEVERNDDEESTKKERVEPKKRIVLNPQPKLNADRLRGPRGLATVESYFTNMEFAGKGHEKHDLDKVMRRLEHWCHRLFPKFQFDDCLERIENLGKKKVVQTYVKKIRLDMVDIISDIVPEHADLEENTVLPDDDFDMLLDQQLEQLNKPVMDIVQPVQPKPLTDEQREAINRKKQLAQEKRLARLQAEKNVPLSEDPESIPNSTEQTNMDIEIITESPAIAINDEQRARMLHNRKIAEQRRLERYKAAQEKLNKSIAAETTQCDTEDATSLRDPPSNDQTECSNLQLQENENSNDCFD